MSSAGQDMGKDKVSSVLFRLGAPAMISMFFQNLYALVDTMFVGWLGPHPLASMSLCIPLIFISLALGKGLAVGATTLASRARGEDRPEQASRIIRSVLPLGLIILLPFVLISLPMVNQALFLRLGAHADTLTQIAPYMIWVGPTYPVMGAALICEGIFLSYGDAKTPMIAMIAGNLLNLVLDPFLIFYCNLGVQGASLASLLGWALSGALMWHRLIKKGLDRPVPLCRASDRNFWRPILVMGSPVALSLLIIPLSSLAFNLFLVKAGPAYVGGWALSARVEMMLTLPIYGLACALIPFCGFNLGRKDAARIGEATGFVLMVSYVIMVPVALYFHFKAPQVLALMRPDPGVLEQAAFCLSWAVAGYFFLPFELVAGTVAQGVGQPRYALVINLVRLLALRLPLAFVFMNLWGGRGIYLSHPVSMSLTGLASIFILRHIMGQVSILCRPVLKKPSISRVLPGQ